jgi:hypothetical protein
MAPFITDMHIGYLCVHFVDTDDRIRWGIDQRWRDLGEYTLARVSSDVLDDLGPSHPSAKSAVQGILTEMAVQAAADPTRHQYIPCRAFALMLALGVSCILIEAERSTLQVRAVAEIRGSPEAADKWFDELEASCGRLAIRTRSYGTSGYEVAIPLAGDGPPVSVDELALSLPREIAEQLAEQLAQSTVHTEMNPTRMPVEAARATRH